MTGAIEFMRAWRDICNEQEACSSCPIQKACESEAKVDAWDFTDEGINNLITAVMTEKRKREAAIKQAIDDYKEALKPQEFKGEEKQLYISTRSILDGLIYGTFARVDFNGGETEEKEWIKNES